MQPSREQGADVRHRADVGVAEDAVPGGGSLRLQHTSFLVVPQCAHTHPGSFGQLSDLHLALRSLFGLDSHVDVRV